jgi:hypothetical protein
MKGTETTVKTKVINVAESRSLIAVSQLPDAEAWKDSVTSEISKKTILTILTESWSIGMV